MRGVVGEVFGKERHHEGIMRSAAKENSFSQDAFTLSSELSRDAFASDIANRDDQLESLQTEFFKSKAGG